MSVWLFKSVTWLVSFSHKRHLTIFHEQTLSLTHSSPPSSIIIPSLLLHSWFAVVTVAMSACLWDVSFWSKKEKHFKEIRLNSCLTSLPSWNVSFVEVIDDLFSIFPESCLSVSKMWLFEKKFKSRCDCMSIAMVFCCVREHCSIVSEHMKESFSLTGAFQQQIWEDRISFWMKSFRSLSLLPVEFCYLLHPLLSSLPCPLLPSGIFLSLFDLSRWRLTHAWMPLNCHLTVWRWTENFSPSSLSSSSLR